MISLDKKFIFIHIPKTAGTSIESSLQDPSCIYRANQQKDKFSSPLNHLTLGEIEEDLNDAAFINQCFKFTFVRNPWDKVISECFCPHLLNTGLFKGCKTIKDKIKIACSFAKRGFMGHCRKQIDFVKHYTIKLDFIGRFENLHQDFDCVRNRLGYDTGHLPHKNKSPKSCYRDYFVDETIELVHSTYLEDIEYFNYKYD